MKTEQENRRKIKTTEGSKKEDSEREKKKNDNRRTEEQKNALSSDVCTKRTFGDERQEVVKWY